MKLSYFSYDFWACCCVAPLVFRAPEGPAAREARRPHFVRRRASKPARALRSLRRPPHQWGLVRHWLSRFVSSLSGQAPPPPTGTAAWPSGPSGALHTSGAGCAVGCFDASSRSPSLAPSPSPPLFLNHTQFRMQFPRYPLEPRIHNVGIATFSDSIETSPNRITCNFSEAVPATTHECRSHALTRGMSASVSSRHPTATTTTSSEPP